MTSYDMTFNIPNSLVDNLLCGVKNITMNVEAPYLKKCEKNSVMQPSEYNINNAILSSGTLIPTRKNTPEQCIELLELCGKKLTELNTIKRRSLFIKPGKDKEKHRFIRTDLSDNKWHKNGSKYPVGKGKNTLIVLRNKKENQHQILLTSLHACINTHIQDIHNYAEKLMNNNGNWVFQDTLTKLNSKCTYKKDPFTFSVNMTLYNDLFFYGYENKWYIPDTIYYKSTQNNRNRLRLDSHTLQEHPKAEELLCIYKAKF